MWKGKHITLNAEQKLTQTAIFVKKGEI